MTVPHQVLATFGVCGVVTAISPGRNPWRSTNTLLVRGDRSLAIRRWEGKQAIERMFAEESLLTVLSTTEFRDFAFPIRSLDGRGHVFTSSEVAWTAYELLTGVSPDALHPATPQIVGALLAKFHSASAQLSQHNLRSSRLVALPEALTRLGLVATLLSNVRLFSGLRSLGQAISDNLEELVILPWGLIHGDFVLENILVSDRARLVDFEFARSDLRLFDFAALSAPQRHDNGSFLIASPVFLDRLVESYQCTTSSGMQLSAAERRALPLIAAAHWSFVADDLARAKSRHLPAALDVLCTLIERLS